jgi:hypothetical protein
MQSSRAQQRHNDIMRLTELSVRYLPYKWTDHDESLTTEEDWTLEEIWFYQVIRKGDPLTVLNQGDWEGLRTPKDFTDLMEITTQDNSKLAVFVHVSSPSTYSYPDFAPE